MRQMRGVEAASGSRLGLSAIQWLAARKLMSRFEQGKENGDVQRLELR